MSPQKNHNLTIAVVGATGIVGQEFLKILQTRKFPASEVRVFASDKSAGTKISFGHQEIVLQELQPGCFKKCDVAFFSAGADISLKWAPRAVEEGSFVIDNSSAFRMNPEVPLVVPEVNSHCIPLKSMPSIIANPNCSTIQLVVALKPLSDAFGLKSVIVSTYQSVSGAGKAGIDELKSQSTNYLKNDFNFSPGTFAHSIAFNNIPQIDVFDETGFTFEEKKIMLETQKILNLPALDISATAVRTPTLNGHSEAVWVDIEKNISREEFVACLTKANGLVIADDPQKNIYPMNETLSGQDPVFVGRIRRDLKNPRRWLFWVVADNVRKGAALNGIQIAEKLFDL